MNGDHHSECGSGQVSCSKRCLTCGEFYIEEADGSHTPQVCRRHTGRCRRLTIHTHACMVAPWHAGACMRACMHTCVRACVHACLAMHMHIEHVCAKYVAHTRRCRIEAMPVCMPHGGHVPWKPCRLENMPCVCCMEAMLHGGHARVYAAWRQCRMEAMPHGGHAAWRPCRVYALISAMAVSSSSCRQLCYIG